MKLETMKGLGKPTADKLRRAGVSSLEALAVVDVRSTKIPGMTAEQLVGLRRDAQRTIFASAAERIEEFAGEAMTKVERFLREAADAASAVAAEAQKVAGEALSSAKKSTDAWTKEAARTTKKVARAAETHVRKVERRIGAKNTRRAAAHRNGAGRRRSK